MEGAFDASFVAVDNDFDKVADKMGVVDCTEAAAFADTVGCDAVKARRPTGPIVVLPDLLCPCHLDLFHRYFSLHLYLPDYYHLPVAHEVYDYYYPSS